MSRKENKTYYLTVEGETEKWYFGWLQRAISSSPDASYTVKFDCKIQKDPLKRAKALSALGETEITHIFDRESEEPVHVQQFQTTLDRMKEAENIGKGIEYHLGYSNFAFELWIVLHKADCNGALTHRRQYLPFLNNAYSEQFENLDQYKHEANFKRVLGKLSLEDVKKAIMRSEYIEKKNEENGYALQKYKSYEYYTENPSLSIWKFVKAVMNECEIL